MAIFRGLLDMKAKETLRGTEFITRNKFSKHLDESEIAFIKSMIKSYGVKQYE